MQYWTSYGVRALISAQKQLAFKAGVAEQTLSMALSGKMAKNLDFPALLKNTSSAHNRSVHGSSPCGSRKETVQPCMVSVFLYLHKYKEFDKMRISIVSIQCFV